MGYIVAPAPLMAELRALRRFMLRHPPANNQRAVALFLSLGHHEALVRRLSAAFEERRKRLSHAISAFLPEWRSTDSAGGTSLWLEGPRGIDARGLAEAAAARSVIIEPGDRFFDQTPRSRPRFMRPRHLVDRPAAHRARHPRACHRRGETAGGGVVIYRCVLRGSPSKEAPQSSRRSGLAPQNEDHCAGSPVRQDVSRNRLRVRARAPASSS